MSICLGMSVPVSTIENMSVRKCLRKGSALVLCSRLEKKKDRETETKGWGKWKEK